MSPSLIQKRKAVAELIDSIEANKRVAYTTRAVTRSAALNGYCFWESSGKRFKDNKAWEAKHAKDIVALKAKFLLRKDRRELLRAVQAKIPNEILEIIFGYVAVSTFGTDGETVDDGVKIENVEQATARAISMLKHFPPIAIAAGKKCETAEWDPDVEIARMCIEPATNAILQTLIITPPSISSPNSLQAPPDPQDFPLKSVAGYLRHLELQVDIPAACSMITQIYPAQLYRMQQNIHLLNGWYRQLDSITITILVPRKNGAPLQLRQRGFNGGSTTMLEEVTKLTKTMSELKCKYVTLRVSEKQEGVVIDGPRLTSASTKGKSRENVVRMLVDGIWGQWRVDDRD